jgi:hypothetical protein
MRIRQAPVLDLPHLSKVETELLCLLSGRSQPTETVHVYSELAHMFKLSQQQRHAHHADMAGSAWENLVRQAKRRLKDQGWLDCPHVGFWVLTASGQTEAQKREQAKRLTPKDFGL